MSDNTPANAELIEKMEDDLRARARGTFVSIIEYMWFWTLRDALENRISAEPDLSPEEVTPLWVVPEDGGVVSGPFSHIGGEAFENACDFLEESFDGTTPYDSDELLTEIESILKNELDKYSVKLQWCACEAGIRIKFVLAILPRD